MKSRVVHATGVFQNFVTIGRVRKIGSSDPTPGLGRQLDDRPLFAAVPVRPWQPSSAVGATCPPRPSLLIDAPFSTQALCV